MKNVFLFLAALTLFISCSKKKPKIEENSTVFKDSLVEEEVEEVTVIEDKLIYTVQIAALKNENKELENFENVKLYKENGFIKYRIGPFKSYQEASAFKESGKTFFPDAFTQALQNGKPIHIKEALEISK